MSTNTDAEKLREAAAQVCRHIREIVGAATGSSIAMALAEAEDRIRRLPLPTALRTPMPARVEQEAAAHKRNCMTCGGPGWVCENHRDRPWKGTLPDYGACDCGAGAPCGSCNLAMASAAYVEPYRQALLTIANSAPLEKPDGPYDEHLGGYSSDNYGDVISDAEALCSWSYAEQARAVLAKARGEA